jgi:hypothetical protein
VNGEKKMNTEFIVNEEMKDKVKYYSISGEIGMRGWYHYGEYKSRADAKNMIENLKEWKDIDN